MTGDPNPTNNLVSLHGHAIPTQEPDQDVIDLLETLLREAHSGDLQAIAYAATFQDNSTRNDWTGNAGGLQLLGAVTLLKIELGRVIIDND